MLRHETNRISKLRYVTNVESERPPRARRLSPTFFFPPNRVRFSVTRDSGTTCVIRILRVYTHGGDVARSVETSWIRVRSSLTHRILPFIKSIEMCSSRTRVNTTVNPYIPYKRNTSVVEETRYTPVSLHLNWIGSSGRLLVHQWNVAAEQFTRMDSWPSSTANRCQLLVLITIGGCDSSTSRLSFFAFVFVNIWNGECRGGIYLQVEIPNVSN